MTFSTNAKSQGSLSIYTYFCATWRYMDIKAWRTVQNGFQKVGGSACLIMTRYLYRVGSVRGRGLWRQSSTSTLLPTLLQTGQIGQTGVCAEMKIRILPPCNLSVCWLTLLLRTCWRQAMADRLGSRTARYHAVMPECCSIMHGGEEIDKQC